MTRPLPALLGLTLLCAAAGTAWAGNPLLDNLKVLRERAAQKSAPAPRPRRPLRRAPIRRVRAVSFSAPGSRVPAGLVYRGERFGSKPRGGDLIVRTTGADGPTHVYISQRLVSNGGNGEARVPDLAPAKVPVLVWSPESGKRRTYWVPIRPGQVAELQARL